MELLDLASFIFLPDDLALLFLELVPDGFQFLTESFFLMLVSFQLHISNLLPALGGELPAEVPFLLLYNILHLLVIPFQHPDIHRQIAALDLQLP